MELALLRSLMDKPFYEEHRGARCLIDCLVKMQERLSNQ